MLRDCDLSQFLKLLAIMHSVAFCICLLLLGSLPSLSFLASLFFLFLLLSLCPFPLSCSVFYQ